MIRLCGKHVSDEEYVASLRRFMVGWDRWRVWLVLFYAGLLVFLIWTCSNIPPLVLKLVQPEDPSLAVLGFVFGTMTGLAFGHLLHRILFGLLFALGGMRAERLLLRVYENQYGGQFNVHGDA